MRFSCVILLLLYNWECRRFVSFLFGLFCSLCLWEFDSEWVRNKGTDSITCLLKVLFILDKRKISINNSQICGPNLVMAMVCFCVACQLRMVYIVLKSCKKQNKECTIEIRCGLQSLKYLVCFITAKVAEPRSRKILFGWIQGISFVFLFAYMGGTVFS